MCAQGLQCYALICCALLCSAVLFRFASGLPPVLRIQGVQGGDRFSESDPFVRVKFGEEVQQTRVEKGVCSCTANRSKSYHGLASFRVSK